jgi:hypothetical protein
MPEIAPSPDFVANIDQPFTSRSSGLQAWGTYGVLWPVVHYELGVAPDLGRHRVSVVPQILVGQSSVGGSAIRLGRGSIDVSATRQLGTLTTMVHRNVDAALTIGVMLPAGTHATSVRLDGHAVSYRVVSTARGTQILARADSRTATLVVRYAD